MRSFLLILPFGSPIASSKDERNPQPQLSAPSESQILAAAQQLHTLRDEKTQIRTITFAAQNNGLPSKPRDCRLPRVGSVLERWYAGFTNRVRVLDNGFRWGKKTYKTITEVATAIKTKHQSGFTFRYLGSNAPPSYKAVAGSTVPPRSN